MKLAIQSMSRVWGGNEKWFCTVAKGLIAKGHDVVVSCPSGPVRQRMESAGIRTSRVRPRGKIDPVSGLSFVGWLQLEQPDAVLATSWHSISWVAAACTIARIRMVVRLGIVRRAPRFGPRALAFRTIVDGLIVNAPEVRDEWLRTSPRFPAEKIHLILNAVEQEPRNRQVLAARLRSELGLPIDTFIVGGAGNISERKGFDITLRAMKMSDRQNAHVVIVGDGPSREALENLATELGISDRVHWLGRRKLAADVIAGFDIFVLSSRNEGMANVMLEAMAAGIPVIGADVSGVRLALAANAPRPAAGWLVPADQPEALATIIDSIACELAANGDAVRTRTAEARWRVENWFEPRRMVDEAEAAIFGIERLTGTPQH